MTIVYICKSDTLVYQSAKHANFKEISSTKAHRKKKQNTNQQNTETEEQGASSSKKSRRLSNFDMSEFLVGNSIKTTTELFAKANEQKQVGKTDLANFLLSRSSSPSMT